MSRVLVVLSRMSVSVDGPPPPPAAVKNCEAVSVGGVVSRCEETPLIVSLHLIDIRSFVLSAWHQNPPS